MMNIPAELNTNPTAIGELAVLKGRLLAGDPTLTDAERARVNTVAPYNLDAWDGYAVEREQILGLAAQQDKNLVVLAGDTHNAWASNLRTADGTAVGVELATPSVSSPGLEAFFGLTDTASAQGLEGALTTLIDDLQYTNCFDRGYAIVTLTPEQASAEWHFVDTIKDQNYQMQTDRQQRFNVLPGAGQRTLVS